MLKALSQNPKLLRFCSVITLMAAVSLTPVSAADTTNASPENQEAKPAQATLTIATNSPAAEAKPVESPADAPKTDVPATSAAATAAPALATPKAAAPVAESAKTNVPPTSLEAFKLIADRNIFNQSRSPRVSSATRPPSTNEVRRAPRVEAFALVGTMSYEKGDIAFFDSGNSQYRKTVKLDEEIAGYKLKEVKPTHVALAKGDEVVELKISQQLRREDDGPWQVGSYAGGGFASSGGSTGSSTSSSPSGSSTSGGGSASEILKRLMEQRARER